jgi:hypothetical protein
MTQSKTIKDQAATAKRAATAIRNIIKQLEWEKSQNQPSAINAVDQNALIKAAGILARLGATKTQVAKKTKLTEIAREQATAIATTEAKYILETWPAAESILDKISFIIGNGYGYSLQRYLHEGIPIWGGREVNSDDWRELLDQLMTDAQKSIPSSLAYNAVKQNKPIADVMSEALDKLNAIKKKPGTLILASQLETKIKSVKDVENGKS